MDIVELLLSRIKVNAAGCFEWQATLCKGYGVLRINGRQRLAHRLSYAHFRRDIPDGLFVCHHCDNPRCINPSHLFLGTNTDNIRDAVRKSRMATGQRNGQSKLTQECADEIVRRYESGESVQCIAASFSVDKTTVYDILNGLRWTASKVILRRDSAVKGERHGMAKLSESSVSEIRQKYSAGANQECLASHYGVSRASISNIVLRRSWKHVQ